jgi:periplasmic protein TorT
MSTRLIVGSAPTGRRGECQLVQESRHRNRSRRLFEAALWWGLALALAPPAAAEPLLVKSYYGRYDVARKVPGLPSASLQPPRVEPWTMPVPRRRYRIGVLFPHLQDPYWESANYGIVAHARRLGVDITLYTAGAYNNFGNQRAQLERLATRDKVDGIILAAVDYHKTDPFVKAVRQAGIPVVGLINDIYAPEISAKSLVSFFEMGYKIGEYVVRHAAGRDCKIAVLPGPKDTGWAPDSLQGFLAAVAQLKSAGQSITLLQPLYGDTRQDVQRMRLDVLSREENRGLDYIVANAVAAVEAVAYLEAHRYLHPRARVVSTYITSKVYEKIQEKTILAAPSDQSLNVCRIALDMVVKILNGEQSGQDFPFRAAPLIPLITHENITDYEYETLFGTRGFAPLSDRF